MEIRRRVTAFYHNTFNLTFACISAAWNGAWVLYINSTYDAEEWLRAALVQAVMSFFLTGVTARIIQHFSPLPFWSSYILGSVLPAGLTFVVVCTIHMINGTPALGWSVFEPTLTSFVTSFGTNFLTRRGVRVILPANYPGKI